MFSLHILGDPVLRGPGGSVTGRAAYRRRIALLAVLALARGRPVGRERLVALLWPELPGDAARRTLSESLYVLRKELGEDVFETVGDEIALNPAVVRSDAGDFEEALEAGDGERAAGIYRGPLLDGFYVDDAPEFERWVDDERDRLARAYAAALERLAEVAEAEGSALRSVEWWRRLAAHDPFSSRVALRLLGALEAAGEHEAALRFADAHAARLRAELGVEPQPEMTARVARLRSRPVADPPPRESGSPHAPASPARAGAASTDAVARPPSPSAASRDDASSSPAAPVSPDCALSPDGPVSPDVRGSSDVPASPDAPVSPAVPSSAGPRTTARVSDMSVGEGGEGRSGRFAMRGARWRRAAAVVALALVGGLAVAVLPGRQRAPGDPIGPPGRDPRHVAVLYFDDLSPRGDLQYLATGLTEGLIAQLARVDALRVVSRNGVKPYRDGTVSLDSVASALRVGSLVEGSVQRAGDSVRVTVGLVDAVTQTHLESRTVIRRADDLFALEDAVAEEVAGFLRRRLGREVRLRERRAETESDAALDLVLRAEEARGAAARLRSRQALDVAGVGRLLGSADSLLALAERADPAWVRPVVLRGWVTLEREMAVGGPGLLDRSRDYADRALRRDPHSAAARELRGRVGWEMATRAADTTGLGGLLGGAEADLRAAVEGDPSLATAWSTLSQLLRFRGRFAEADQAARRALEEDAYLEDGGDVLHRLYAGALMVGDYRAAGGFCGQGRERFPADWRFAECRLTLLREDPSLPADPALARSLVATLDSMDPAPRARAQGRGYSPVYRLAVEAAVLARAGRGDDARAALARARAAARGDDDAPISLDYDEAIVRLMLGERDAARRLVDRYLARRPTVRPFVERDPLLRGLFTASPPARPRTPGAG